MRFAKILKLFSAALFVIQLGFGSASAAPLRIAYSAISGAMSSLWVAQEGGYFKREGLDTELLYIGGGSLLIQSMLSGEVPFAYGPSVPVINASLRGSDLVLIGNTGNALVFSIMSRPEIKQPAQLKGKKVGVTRLGGSTDWALDAALKQWNLERGRDLIVIQTGGMPEGLAALIAGALDAVVLSPPSNFRAMKARYARAGRCRPVGHYFSEHAVVDDQNFHQIEPRHDAAVSPRLYPGLEPVAHGQRIQHEGAVEIYQGDGHRDAGATASNLRRAL